MINETVQNIINKSKINGWILEPDSKSVMMEYNLPVPEYTFAKDVNETVEFAINNGFPVVCKIVSPDIIHKSDVNGVITGIDNEKKLKESFDYLKKLKGFQGVLVEQTVSGTELIVGAKNDEQFGPVVLVGLGGVGVEIYKDIAMRMAPLSEKDIEEMLQSLTCFKLLKGYRGVEGININKFIEMLMDFSKMIMDIEPFFESVDLNPVMCDAKRCYIADARIILLKTVLRIKD